MLRIASVSLFAALTALLAPTAAAAEAYPQKAIRLLIPFPPGGGTDIIARGLQDKFEAALGGPVIDNRGGAGGTLGCTLAARAAPDGYTLLFTFASYTFAPSLYKQARPRNEAAAAMTRSPSRRRPRETCALLSGSRSETASKGRP